MQIISWNIFPKQERTFPNRNLIYQPNYDSSPSVRRKGCSVSDVAVCAEVFEVLCIHPDAVALPVENLILKVLRIVAILLGDAVQFLLCDPYRENYVCPSRRHSKTKQKLPAFQPVGAELFSAVHVWSGETLQSFDHSCSCDSP